MRLFRKLLASKQPGLTTSSLSTNEAASHVEPAVFAASLPANGGDSLVVLASIPYADQQQFTSVPPDEENASFSPLHVYRVEDILNRTGSSANPSSTPLSASSSSLRAERVAAKAGNPSPMEPASSGCNDEKRQDRYALFPTGTLVEAGQPDGKITSCDPFKASVTSHFADTGTRCCLEAEPHSASQGQTRVHDGHLNVLEVAAQGPRCRSGCTSRNIFRFSDLPDVCVRLCFSFLSVEENLKYQVISRDVRRAVGLDKVLLYQDTSFSRAEGEGMQLETTPSSGFPPDEVASESECEETLVSAGESHTSSLPSCDDSIFAASSRDAARAGVPAPCNGAALASAKTGTATPVSFLKTAHSLGSQLSKGGRTTHCRRHDTRKGNGHGDETQGGRVIKGVGRGATACVFASYRSLVVGVSWLGAKPAVRAAYLSQFTRLIDLKIFFCPFADPASESCPTCWRDLLMLLQNNQNSLQRLSVVSLPYAAELLLKPQRTCGSTRSPCVSSPSSSHDGVTNAPGGLRGTMGTRSHRLPPAPDRERGQDESSSKADREAETVSWDTSVRGLETGGLSDGLTGFSFGPYSSGAGVYLFELREFSIVGSAASCLVTLDAMQTFLPHSLESFSLHGNLPRTLPCPLFSVSRDGERESTRVTPGRACASSAAFLKGLGLHGVLQRLFGWRRPEGMHIERAVGTAGSAAHTRSNLEGAGSAGPSWRLEANREILLRSVMTMHSLKVLDIRLPPALDLFSVRLVPSLVLLSTRLRKVTLDVRQLTELVDLGILTANTVIQPFGAEGLGRQRASTYPDDSTGIPSDSGLLPAEARVHTLLPNLREVTLREPLHLGWSVHDVARFAGILSALPQCTVTASSLVLHQHPLLGTVLPFSDHSFPSGQTPCERRDGDTPSGESFLRRCGDLGGSSDNGDEAVGADGAILSISESVDESARDRSLRAEMDMYRESVETDSGERRNPDGSLQNGDGEDRSHLEAEWEEGETGDGFLVGRAQYRALLHEIIEHLAPNICSLRVRYTSSTTCDLPLSFVSFPALQELVLDNYLPDVHLEIDRIVVPRTHVVTVDLNGHQLGSTHQREFEELREKNRNALKRHGVPRQGSYLRLFRALEPVSYCFRGLEDVLFLLALNEELLAEVSPAPASRSSPVRPGSTEAATDCGPACAKLISGRPGLLCLSITVSGKDLRDSAQKLLADAERYMKENKTFREDPSDGGSEYAGVVGSSPECPEVELEEALTGGSRRSSSQKEEDPFYVLNLQQLFPAHPHSGAALASPVSGEDEEVDQNPQPASTTSVGFRVSQYTRNASWPSPSSMFGGCLRFDDVEAAAIPVPRRTPYGAPQASSETNAVDAENVIDRRWSLSETVQSGRSSQQGRDRRSVFSRLASRVFTFLEKNLGGICGEVITTMPAAGNEGGVLLAVSVLALIFGDDATASEVPNISACLRNSRYQDRHHYSTRPLPQALEGFVAEEAVSRPCLKFVGLTIVDLDMQATSDAITEDVLFAATCVIDERFGRNSGMGRGCDPLVPASQGSQVSLDQRLHASTIPLTPTKTAEPPLPSESQCPTGGRGLRVSIEQPLRPLRARPFRTELSSSEFDAIEFDRQLHSIDKQTGFGGMEPTPRNSGKEGAVVGVPRCGVTGSSGIVGEPIEMAKRRNVDKSLLEEETPGEDSYMTATGTLLWKPPRPDQTVSSRDGWHAYKPHRNEHENAAFCCPVIGCHLERLLEAFPTLMSVQLRYSGQHPLYLLDDQALRSALEPATKFLRTRCGFVEISQGATVSRVCVPSGSCCRTATKLGFACERFSGRCTRLWTND